MSESLPSLTFAEAIHRIQFSLIETSVCPEPQLLDAGAILSQSDYSDVVIERTIAELCGYPCCPNPLPVDRPQRGRYRIALSEHRVYDVEETRNYCSPNCLVRSKAFSASLPDERFSELSSTKIERVLNSFGYAPTGEILGKNRDLGLPNLTIREKDGAGGVPFDQWVGPSNAIEGYIPQRDRIQGLEYLSGETRRATHSGHDEIDFTSAVMIGEAFDETSSAQLIAKQLEDVAISEKGKKTKKKRTVSKSSKSKSTKKSADDTTSGVGSVTSKKDQSAKLEKLGSSRRSAADKQPLNEEHTEKRAQSMGAALKSSLKGSGLSKSGKLSVRWADERAADGLEERMEGLEINEIKPVSQPRVWSETTKGLEERMEGLEINESKPVSIEEVVDNSLLLASAEACAAGLAMAAEAVASGDSEVGDAVSEAGIVILPQPPHGDEEGSEVDEDMFVFEHGVVKWPKKPVLLDTDMFEVEDSWHDTPPGGFSLTLSSFATMWMSLFAWITCSSLAHIYGHDESSQDDYLVVNGREYPHRIFLRDGKSSEIRQTLDGCISRALPGLVRELGLPIPVSHLERALGGLLDTMTFVDALPALRMRQWQVIVLLFIDALSLNRLPVLAPHMTNRDILLRKVLDAAQVSGEEYDSMKELIMPLGRLPQFSMQSGA